MKAQLSSYFTNLSGLLSGAVVQNNPNGLIVRSHKPITNAFNTAQNSRRVNFSKVANTWSGLSSGTKSSWRTAALLYTFKNRYGLSFTPTAQQLYTWCQMNRLSIGQSIGSTIPSSQNNNIPTLTANNVIIASSSWQFIDVINKATGWYYVLFLSKSLPQSAYQKQPLCSYFTFGNSPTDYNINAYSLLNSLRPDLLVSGSAFYSQIFLQEITTGQRTVSTNAFWTVS